MTQSYNHLFLLPVLIISKLLTGAEKIAYTC
jgi:hypothetical protein